MWPLPSLAPPLTYAALCDILFHKPYLPPPAVGDREEPANDRDPHIRVGLPGYEW